MPRIFFARIHFVFLRTSAKVRKVAVIKTKFCLIKCIYNPYKTIDRINEIRNYQVVFKVVQCESSLKFVTFTQQRESYSYIKDIVMKKLFLGLALLAGLSACNNSEKVDVKFALTDAPSLKGYQALYVDVQSIEYSIGDSLWVSLPMTPSVVNILDLTNGKDTLLANIELESGQVVSQIRMILGDNSTLILADGTEVNVKVPSGQTSGLKFNVHSTATINSGYRVVIDFDAERSIVAKGNGQYSLKPVIRGYITANTSSIYGTLLPANVPFQVRTVFNGDTISTVSDTLNANYFKLQGLTTGSYHIEFVDADGVIRHDIDQEVHGGTNINLGSVQIP
jgi:hypothetical protein